MHWNIPKAKRKDHKFIKKVRKPNPIFIIAQSNDPNLTQIEDKNKNFDDLSDFNAKDDEFEVLDIQKLDLLMDDIEASQNNDEPKEKQFEEKVKEMVELNKKTPDPGIFSHNSLHFRVQNKLKMSLNKESSNFLSHSRVK